jgi:hypothetical protein
LEIIPSDELDNKELVKEKVSIIIIIIDKKNIRMES